MSNDIGVPQCCSLLFVSRSGIALLIWKVQASRTLVAAVLTQLRSHSEWSPALKWHVLATLTLTACLHLLGSKQAIPM